jgi:hypothetical protein
MGNFHNLDNEEILFIYITNKKFLDKYESIFDAGGIEKSLDLQEGGLITAFRMLTDEDIDEIKKDNHYLYCLSVDKKLSPIIDIIRETLPELYDKILESFNDTLS